MSAGHGPDGSHSPNNSVGPVQIHRVEIWISGAFEIVQFDMGAIFLGLVKEIMVDRVLGGQCGQEALGGF